jgi:hypothetical protein|tara:strand:- start:19 stop:144 length:126 start_codon:yes stop_codon:yes gene_type:complete
MKLPDFRFNPIIQNLHRSMGIEVMWGLCDIGDGTPEGEPDE